MTITNTEAVSDLREPISGRVWPLSGYAPGNYHCQCVDCGTIFEGDKRAVQCLDCAVRSVNNELLSRRAANSAGGVEVKALEWVDHTKGPGCPIRRIAQTATCVVWLFQAGEADLWYLSYNSGLNGKFLAKGDETAARAAAQADFNTRILSALSSPSHIGEDDGADDLSALIAEQLPSGLPKAYGGCTCTCHRRPGVMHIAPCCRPSDNDKSLFSREWFERKQKLEGDLDITVGTPSPSVPPQGETSEDEDEMVRDVERYLRDNPPTALTPSPTLEPTDAEVERGIAEALEALNVTDAELVRIHNMCTGFDGDVKIWSKMLHKLTVFAMAMRALIASRQPTSGEGV